MGVHKKRISLNQIQWIIWLLLFGMHVITVLRYNNLVQSFVYSFIVITSYMMVIYGNASLLIPKLYQKQRRLLYFFSVVLLLGLTSLYRNASILWVTINFFSGKQEPLNWIAVFSGMASSLLIYFTSVLFYISIHYFSLREQQEAMQRRQLEAELNLLKAQVQPHFLFNTLNNIYFYAQRESPLTAALLEKLSLIMRYFVDEAPKDKIPLQVELDFIRHYIDLEKTRMRYPLEIIFEEPNTYVNTMVPPMLIIPLVENVFKHGIDKRREDNFIFIQVEQTANELKITVRNRIAQTNHAEDSGKGLINLQNRLALLFGSQYQFISESVAENQYTSILTIPV